MVGSIYSRHLRSTHTKREWQVHIYEGTEVWHWGVESPAMTTVVLNGIVIQNNFILKDTRLTLVTEYQPTATSLMLQDHGPRFHLGTFGFVTCEAQY